eukprot:TRINITY_DN8323_c0_g1::TRINITY_DN8323_c0_g1_i1::g.29183::m.29183 TRINITY_DN8323_c0_g1::TRINITY_DN8323_c0_g1_i1::g.29183  ORF type:complete len:381 (+),score=47.77,sp/Q3T906/GNPTA_HUMAN/35.92/8e-11,Notch/PF00066.12/4e-06,Notch/PF00066.12/3.7e-06,Notch/PF00066.12/3.8e-08,CMV_US/PF08001.6/3.9,CMV_US/PF08001.6/55,Pertactin/PF03212.9/0.092,EphA2_TM/PF14575.1/0.12,Adeno_E3_CR2/PF02439.10/0.95 TRINITY_DN8323_c0_g1_i1:119-1261(+)
MHTLGLILLLVAPSLCICAFTWEPFMKPALLVNWDAGYSSNTSDISDMTEFDVHTGSPWSIHHTFWLSSSSSEKYVPGEGLHPDGGNEVVLAPAGTEAVHLIYNVPVDDVWNVTGSFSACNFLTNAPDVMVSIQTRDANGTYAVLWQTYLAGNGAFQLEVNLTQGNSVAFSVESQNSESSGLDDATCLSAEIIGSTQEHGECAPGCAVTWIGDGVCDVACATDTCSKDNGDCEASDKCPGDCLPAWRGDGDCDYACNIRICGWDNGDCPQVLQCSVLGCAPRWLGDGDCDPACNVSDCEWDMGDCGTQRGYIGDDDSDDTPDYLAIILGVAVSTGIVMMIVLVWFVCFRKAAYRHTKLDPALEHDDVSSIEFEHVPSAKD